MVTEPRGILGTIHDWLDGGESEAVAAKLNGKSGPPGQQADPDAQKSRAQEFESNLKDAIANGGAAAGRLQILDLESARERLGGKWDALEPRIHRHIDLLLDLRLGPGDSYFRYDSAHYYVLFGDGEAGAEARMAALAEEIVTKVLGTDAVLSELELGTSVTALDEVDPAAPLADVATALENAGETKHEAQSGPSQAGADADWLDRLRELIEEAGAELDRLFKSEVEADWGAALKTRHRVLTRVIETARTEIAGLADGATPVDAGRTDGTAPVGLDGAEEAALVRLVDSIIPGPQSLAFHYLPVWTPVGGVVRIFACQAVAAYEDYTLPLEDMRALRGKADHLMLIDCITLKRAVVDLQELDLDGSVAVVSVPVHITTLTRPSSAVAFLNICRAMPERLRRLIVWEVLGADSNSWSSHIVQRAAPLARFGRGMTIRVPVGRRELDGLSRPGVLGLSAAAESRPGDAADQAGALAGFVARARAAKLMANVWDVHEPELAEAVIAAGADNIRGDVVGGPRNRPSRMIKLDLQSLAGRATG
ncbi:MAG: hypothetical protein MI755_04730 [Sphingomonadales bacterium]|nr:hypothetical protein [Sphingomonadales bacterium]